MHTIHKFIFIVLIITLFYVIANIITDTNTENFDALSNEAVQNIASVYSDVKNTIKANNLTLTGDLKSTNITSTDLKSTTITGTNINGTDLKIGNASITGDLTVNKMIEPISISIFWEGMQFPHLLLIYNDSIISTWRDGNATNIHNRAMDQYVSAGDITEKEAKTRKIGLHDYRGITSIKLYVPNKKMVKIWNWATGAKEYKSGYHIAYFNALLDSTPASTTKQPHIIWAGDEKNGEYFPSSSIMGNNWGTSANPLPVPKKI